MRSVIELDAARRHQAARLQKVSGMPDPGQDEVVRRSALWAAWGDALGWPMELTRDPSDLDRRFHGRSVETTIPWRRRIGGRAGVDVELPAGTYSDDTQLRLAVGRCIRAPRRFDVEVFSKIELPVFLSYGFGVGHGTRAAAQSLGKRSVRWFSNFFSSYTSGGGNGAAMRVQPHVWASPNFAMDAYVPGVVKDSVCTHGHMRGIIGAVVHAVSLGETLRGKAVPPPPRWRDLVGSINRTVSDAVVSDPMLFDRWLPAWERDSQRSWKEALAETFDECLQQTERAKRISGENGDLEGRYTRLAKELGGLEPSTRGSGTTSAVLALWLAHESASDPSAALRCAANLLGSDTDTVGSMAGALLGVCAPDDPPGPLVDSTLISNEAKRLAGLASGRTERSFPHPDPLKWRPPSTQADTLGILDGKPAVAGLGHAMLGDREARHPGAEPQWHWVKLDFGQTLLIKRRADLPDLKEFTKPKSRPPASDQLPLALPGTGVDRPANQAARRSQEIHPRPPTPRSRRRDDLPEDPEEGAALVVRSRFENILVARLLMHYAKQKHGVTKAAVFAGLVAKEVQDQLSRGQSGR